MKLDLTTTLVGQMSMDKVPTPGVPYKDWPACDKANYLIYDSHKAAPPGFAIRVGKRASVWLVERQVKGKNLKIHVGLAKGKKGAEPILDIETAREKARELSAVAVRHGTNPKKIADRIEASELTLGQVWSSYIDDLLGRARPIKPNSLDSLQKARNKMTHWEDRKVRLITGEEIIALFDHHAVKLGHRTAAEAMGRWATAAVKNAIDNEVHNAHAEGRTPTLTYNPFTILATKQKYRKHADLEREYHVKGVRNPLSFSSTVGPFVETAWAYRRENAVAADFMLLDLMWGLRGDECRTLQWRDQVPTAELLKARWIDMDARVARINDAKNREDHEFPIGPFAYELLKLRRSKQAKGERWVFPARSAVSKKGHYSDPSVAMATVRERAGIKMVRGHDLRRTFGAACEKLGLNDRQVKRMLGHAVGGGETLGRYTGPEWEDVVARMVKIEEMILTTAPDVYNALRPAGVAALPGGKGAVIPPLPARKSRAKRPR